MKCRIKNERKVALQEQTGSTKHILSTGKLQLHATHVAGGWVHAEEGEYMKQSDGVNHHK